MSTAISSSPSPAASPRSSFHAPSPRNAFAPPPRSSPRHYPSSSPRRTFNAPAPASATHQPKPNQHFVESGPVASSFAGYVDAATQYSPDGLPPTAGRKVAAAAERPLGSSASGARKRKDGAPTDNLSDSSMTSTSASSGASQPRTSQAPAEPRLRSDPAAGTSSNDPEPEEARSTHGHSAAPKRSKAEGTVKIMPAKYETCNPKDLGVLISNMLMELIRINDRIPLRDGRLTRFHSRAPPGISVSDYLQRLIQHATLSPPILLSMVYYIDRLCNMYSAFTINSLTVHRFLITAATVAAKGLSDSFWTNPTYARIGGIPVSELATLELEFLQRVQWRIVPKPEVLEEYYQSLVDRTDGYDIEESSTSESESASMGDSEAASKQTSREKGRIVDKDGDDNMG
ncbi:hypothetical protein PRZ48_003226 [Zasmidium cellare]|uniref:Nuc-1 negative regulatory protein preg n=1 Tax=Zasmidium cellare TaxID=395010 RepID=A0ABR0EVR8_ZASCE|nr:hypothetical protein PRZ48_003226 [Zasmidium cellare]